MPATNTANNPLLSLVSATAKSSANNRSEAASGQLFEASLNQRLQTRQNEQLAKAAAPSKSPQSTTPVQSQPAKVAEPEKPATAQQTKPAEPTKAPAKEAGSEGKAVKDKSADKADDGQDAAEADPAQQAAAAAMAAMLAQLQQMQVEQGAGAPPPVAEDATTLVGDVLQGEDKAFSLAELTAKLATERQALPGDAAADKKRQLLEAGKDLLAGQQAAAEPTTELTPVMSASAATENFAQLLDQRVQSGAAAAATQQTQTPMIRMETGKSQTFEQTRAAVSIQHPVGGEGWDKALGNKVIMMVSNQQQEVELHLNPPHLGPMEVKLSLNQDQATLTFVAAQQPVRDALQASLPKLSEMLAESGIQLAQANVQSQSSQDGGREQSSGRQGGRGRSEGVEDIANQPASWQARLPISLPGNVNLFV
ncbi:flagellar hook-length control protein FliK [Chitinimonas naiadis]